MHDIFYPVCCLAINDMHRINHIWRNLFWYQTLRHHQSLIFFLYVFIVIVPVLAINLLPNFSQCVFFYRVKLCGVGSRIAIRQEHAGSPQNFFAYLNNDYIMLFYLFHSIHHRVTRVEKQIRVLPKAHAIGCPLSTPTGNDFTVINPRRRGGAPDYQSMRQNPVFNNGLEVFNMRYVTKTVVAIHHRGIPC